MHRHRKILLALAIVLVVGSISTTLGYALYIRGDAYRHWIEASVSDYLELPTEITRVVPLSRRSRQFSGIRVWLPGRNTQIFDCKRTVWRSELHDGRETNALDIHDGWFLLGTGEFSPDDYRRMLRGGLGHNFSELELSTVRLHGVDIFWRQPELELRVEGAAGEVLLADDGLGRAVLAADRLNGTTVAEPIAIRALFTPGSGVRFHHVALEVPRISLEALALDRVLGGTVSKGWFTGTLTFREPDRGEPVCTLRGAVEQARLSELTRRLPTGALHGRVNIDLHEAALTPSEVVTLAFNGELADMQLADLGHLVGRSDLEGRITLNVHQADYRDRQLAHLTVSAAAQDVSLAALTDLLGCGVITGTLRVTVNSLVVVDDEVRFADIDIDVVPPDDGPGTIDRDMIIFVARQLLDVDMGRAADYLPQHVTYARIGCKALIEGRRLTIKGSHGHDGRTILTVRVLRRNIGLVRQPRRSYPIVNLVDLVRDRAVGDVDRLRQWWLEQQEDDPAETPRTSIERP